MFVLLGFAAVAAPAYAAFNWFINSTVAQLGTLFAEKQALYDRHRGLGALLREVSLAETLAGSQAIRDWSLNEDDPVLARRGLAELEHYRQTFADGSYFFVIGNSGNYYFNDTHNAYAGEQLRYTVSPDNPRDTWYYSTIALGEGCHLNVDNDANLRVTKVWMNCVIREGNRVLGVLGTGIDLSAFVQEVVNVPQVGVTSMFVDRQGLVQAHRDERLINLASLDKSMREERTVFSMLDNEADRTTLREMMAAMAEDGTMANSAFVSVGGQQMLAGIGYLDKLGWFNVSLMDIDTIIDRRYFQLIGALVIVMIGLVALVMVLVFNRIVLRRLENLESAVRRARVGDFREALNMGQGQRDEIGRLSTAFTEMAAAVHDHTSQLEARVSARTRELEQLAFKDGQTGILNRRGFSAAHAKVSGERGYGLLLVDIDHFKAINDSFGHAAGDVVVLEVARRIGLAIGAGNSCARWGGDEFIVLLPGSDPNLLRSTAHSVMAAIRENPIVSTDGRHIQVTVSIGACLAEAGDRMEIATDMADAALYMAKGQGRNRVMVFDADMRGTMRAARG